MKYCTRCFYPANHPLGITFDDQGVCSGCRVHEEKDTLDWSVRLAKLQRIADTYRNRERTLHDCIIPVSGARDSHFIVHTFGVPVCGGRNTQSGSPGLLQPSFIWKHVTKSPHAFAQ